MAEKKNEYRTIVGLVKYPVRTGEVTVRDEEVQVRNFVVRQTGVKDQAIDVAATLWPSHEHVELEQGDFVVMEGKLTPRKGTKKDDEGNEIPTTFFNFSVAGIKVFGPLDFGDRDGGSTASSRAAETDDEDVPW